MKSESKKRASFGFVVGLTIKSVGDLKVDGIKLVLLISILGTENVSIIQMTTSPVSSVDIPKIYIPGMCSRPAVCLQRTCSLHRVVREF